MAEPTDKPDDLGGWRPVLEGVQAARELQSTHADPEVRELARQYIEVANKVFDLLYIRAHPGAFAATAPFAGKRKRKGKA